MTNFRSDINRTIKESSDYVYPYFESKDNATYKSIIDIYLQNPDHYDHFESKTDNIYDIKERWSGNLYHWFYDDDLLYRR